MVERRASFKGRPAGGTDPSWSQPIESVSRGERTSMGCFGHAVFIVLHVLAALFGFVLLFVTIPAHLIFMAIISGKKRR